MTIEFKSCNTLNSLNQEDKQEKIIRLKQVLTKPKTKQNLGDTEEFQTTLMN